MYSYKPWVLSTDAESSDVIEPSVLCSRLGSTTPLSLRNRLCLLGSLFVCVCVSECVCACPCMNVCLLCALARACTRVRVKSVRVSAKCVCLLFIGSANGLRNVGDMLMKLIISSHSHGSCLSFPLQLPPPTPRIPLDCLMASFVHASVCVSVCDSVPLCALVFPNFFSFLLCPSHTSVISRPSFCFSLPPFFLLSYSLPLLSLFLNHRLVSFSRYQAKWYERSQETGEILGCVCH